MTTYKLQKIEITNFKGIAHLEIDLNNTDFMTIYATNGIGKSTIADAHAFLLTGKDSLGRKNFDIRPFGIDYSAIPMVEETYNQYEDGQFFRSFLLARGMKAKNEMRDGIPVYCGDVTYCAIDGMDCKTVKEFDGFIASMIPDVPKSVEAIALNLLTDPAYFTTKIEKNDEQRKIILSLFGEMNEEEYVSQLADQHKKTTYEQLFSQKPTTTDFESWKQNLRKKDIDKQIADLNARIDEQHKSLAEIGEADLSKIETLTNEITELDAKKETLLAQKAEIINGTEVSRLKNKGEQLENSINALNNENAAFKADFSKKVSVDKENEKKPLSDSLTAMNDTLSKTKAALNELKLKQESLVSKNSALVLQYRTTNDEVWTGDTVCPTCNRPLDEDAVEEARNTFNENKVKRLSQIQAEGTTNKLENKSVSAEIEVLQTKYDSIYQEIASIQSQITKINEKYNEIIKNGEKDMPEYAGKLSKLNAEKERIDAQKEALKKNLTPYLEKIKTELEAIANRKTDIDVLIISEKGKESARKTALSQIEKHKVDLTAIVREKSANEEKVAIITDFQIDYYTTLQKKLNENFTEGVRFRLFSFNKSNGEFKNQFDLLGLCERTGKYRLYSGINTAQQYKTNLALMDSISRKIGVRFPVLSDNAERVTANFTIENQMIVFRAVGQKVNRIDFVRNDAEYDIAKQNFTGVDTVELLERSGTPIVANATEDDGSFDLF